MANPTGMPPVAALKTPPAKQGAILQRRAAGQSMRQIARDLGVDRETVARVEAAHFQLPPDATIQEQAKLLIPKALDSLDRHIPEDGGLAMRYLEATLFRETGHGQVVFNDAKLNVAIGLLPDAKPSLSVGEARASAIDVPSSSVTCDSNNVTRPGDAHVTCDTPCPALPTPGVGATEAAARDGQATDTIAVRADFFPISEVKVCSKCGVEKPITEFYNSAHLRKDGTNPRQSRCKLCTNESYRAWAEANPRKHWANWLRHKYELPIEVWDAMLVSQDGRCEVCNEPMRMPCVDHNHETKQVRALLCRGCNTALGSMKENPHRMRLLATYSEKGGT
jgi:hypothetical protein